jgi:hypothetical protein
MVEPRRRHAARPPVILPAGAGVSHRPEEPLTVPARSALALALFGALVLVLSGCGGTVIDDVKAEEETKASLEDSLHEKIKEVDCPSGVKVEADKTFTCTVDFSKGNEATATLKIRDSEANLSLVGLKADEAGSGKANE